MTSGDHKGKGRAQARRQILNSDEEDSDPEHQSDMTLVDYNPDKDAVIPASFTEERDVLQLPVNKLRKAFVQFLIQPVLNERAKQEQFVVSATNCC